MLSQTVDSRAPQYFWGLISQTSNWRLAQNVTEWPPFISELPWRNRGCRWICPRNRGWLDYILRSFGAVNLQKKIKQHNNVPAYFSWPKKTQVFLDFRGELKCWCFLRVSIHFSSVGGEVSLKDELCPERTLHCMCAKKLARFSPTDPWFFFRSVTSTS